MHARLIERRKSYAQLLSRNRKMIEMSDLRDVVERGGRKRVKENKRGVNNEHPGVLEAVEQKEWRNTPS